MIKGKKGFPSLATGTEVCLGHRSENPGFKRNKIVLPVSSCFHHHRSMTTSLSAMVSALMPPLLLPGAGFLYSEKAAAPCSDATLARQGNTPALSLHSLAVGSERFNRSSAASSDTHLLVPRPISWQHNKVHIHAQHCMCAVLQPQALSDSRRRRQPPRTGPSRAARCLCCGTPLASQWTSPSSWRRSGGSPWTRWDGARGGGGGLCAHMCPVVV